LEVYIWAPGRQEKNSRRTLHFLGARNFGRIKHVFTRQADEGALSSSDRSVRANRPCAWGTDCILAIAGGTWAFTARPKGRRGLALQEPTLIAGKVGAIGATSEIDDGAGRSAGSFRDRSCAKERRELRRAERLSPGRPGTCARRPAPASKGAQGSRAPGRPPPLHEKNFQADCTVLHRPLFGHPFGTEVPKTLVFSVLKVFQFGSLK